MRLSETSLGVVCVGFSVLGFSLCLFYVRTGGEARHAQRGAVRCGRPS